MALGLVAERTTYEFLNTGSVAGRAVGQAVLLPGHVRGFDPVTILVVVVASTAKLQLDNLKGSCISLSPYCRLKFGSLEDQIYFQCLTITSDINWNPKVLPGF